MQQLAGALGYGNPATAMASRHQPTVLVSQPSVELTDRMYADLIDSFRYSRESAEKRAVDAEKRAQLAESRLQELYTKLLATEREDAREHGRQGVVITPEEASDTTGDRSRRS